MHASWTVRTIPLIRPGADEIVELDVDVGDVGDGVDREDGGGVGDIPAIEEDDSGLNCYWNSHAIAHFHTYFSIYQGLK